MKLSKTVQDNHKKVISLKSLQNSWRNARWIVVKSNARARQKITSRWGFNLIKQFRVYFWTPLSGVKHHNPNYFLTTWSFFYASDARLLAEKSKRLRMENFSLLRFNQVNFFASPNLVLITSLESIAEKLEFNYSEKILHFKLKAIMNGKRQRDPISFNAVIELTVFGFQ